MNRPLVHYIMLMFSAGSINTMSHAIIPKRRAYFKHYAHCGCPREIIALYDNQGRTIDTLEIPTIHSEQHLNGKTSDEWWYEYFNTTCNEQMAQGVTGWWQVPEREEVLLVQYSNGGGITALQRSSDTAKRLRPEISKNVIMQLYKEIHATKYCSIFKRSVREELQAHIPTMNIEDIIASIAQSINS